MHVECWRTWTEQSNRSCVLLCDVSSKNESLQIALGTLLRLLRNWLVLYALILWSGNEYLFACVHLASAAKVWLILQDLTR